MENTLFLCDLHVGSLVSIWPREGLMPEGGEWKLNLVQKHLARHWDRFLSEMLDVPHLDAVIIVGDVLEGVNSRNLEVVTTRLDYQASAAIDLLSPVRELADRMYILKGTSFHGGEMDQHVTQVAKALDVEPSPSGEALWDDMLYHIGDRDIWHIAHHIGTTRNVSYEATGPMTALTTTKMEYDRAYGRWGPHITGIVRAHRHKMIHVHKPPWHAIALCGWKLKDGFAHKVAPGGLPEYGYALVSYEEEINVKLQTYPLPPPHVENKPT